MNKEFRFVFCSGDRAERASRHVRIRPVNWDMVVEKCTEKGNLPYEKEQCFWIGDANNHRLRKKLLQLSKREPDYLKAIGMEWDTMI